MPKGATKVPQEGPDNAQKWLGEPVFFAPAKKTGSNASGQGSPGGPRRSQEAPDAPRSAPQELPKAGQRSGAMQETCDYVLCTRFCANQYPQCMKTMQTNEQQCKPMQTPMQPASQPASSQPAASQAASQPVSQQTSKPANQ